MLSEIAGHALSAIPNAIRYSMPMTFDKGLLAEGDVLRGGERSRCSGLARDWARREPGGLERNGAAEREILRKRDSQSCIEGRGVSSGTAGMPCPPRLGSGNIQASPSQVFRSDGLDVKSGHGLVGRGA